jgi:hypothetical protein
VAAGTSSEPLCCLVKESLDSGGLWTAGLECDAKVLFCSMLGSCDGVGLE